jgi:ribosomal protein S18 acetylase RimI-like enzyme
MPAPLQISTHEAWPREAAAAVDAGLDAHNDLARPLQDVRALACIAQDPEGRVLGGALGRTWGRCCELQQLWVDDSCRHQGLGTRLMSAFEAAAEARGCTTFYLDTFSFQALGFYRGLGYEVALTIAGYTGGVEKYTLIKHRSPRDPNT